MRLNLLGLGRTNTLLSDICDDTTVVECNDLLISSQHALSA